MSAHTAATASARPIVTAVVVSHNGARWLGDLISALRAQSRPPDRVVAVDTGSRDESRELLAATFGQSGVLDLPARSGFGAAVAEGVQALPAAVPGEWLWLLHDDCAPAPDALAALVQLAERIPAAAVLGPKLRDWPSGRRLLELGVTIAGSGNRETGLEFGEFDQGQHDTVRDVLAVSSAGMLVRRDVYERLGGFDPRYGMFRDDVDFGWRAVRAGHRVMACPQAVVYHAEAGYRGARRLHAVTGRPRRIDRRNAIHTLLVNTAAYLVPLVALRLAIGSLLRVLALLIVKWPDAAYDEFAGAAAALSRPDLVLLGRRRRARTRRVSLRVVRRLLPPPWIGLQHTFDALTAVVSARSGAHAGSSRRGRRSAVETGPVAEEAEELTLGSSGVWRWLVTRPPVLMILGLVVLAGVACRDLLGGGALGGGALLPAPDTVVDLWQRYLESWHEVDLGGGGGAPPYVAVVAALGTLLAGKAWLAVDLLVLGAVPLAGLTSYLLARRLVQARLLRLWVIATYALLPAATGAVAAGRLGTCVAIVVLPVVILGTVHMVGAGRPAVGSWSATWTTGLLLAILCAFVPLGYVAAAIMAVAVAFLPWLHPGSRRRIALAMAIPPLVLVPWLPTLAHNPRAVLGEAGLATPGLTADRLSPTSLLFGSPGGPGAAPVWIFGILLLIALTALLRRDHSRGVLAAWAMSLTGLALGLVQSRLAVTADWIPVPVPSWPGLAAALVAAGWIVAIALAADGASRVFGESSFSWRQPVAGLLAVLAVATPLVAAGWWVIRSADGPLARSGGAAVPPYIRDAQTTPAHPRALVVDSDAGTVRYAVLRDGAARLGDAEVGAGRGTLADLDASVGDLLSDSQHEVTASVLAAYDIGYVYLPAPADPRSVERLDTTPGLTRASAPEGAAAWQVDLPIGALRVLPPGGSSATTPGTAAAEAAAAEVVKEGADGAGTIVPDGPQGRRLVLAEAYDKGWLARLDGRPLRSYRYAGWAQSFELPAKGGRVVLSHAPSNQDELPIAQGVLVVLFLIFALPSQARRIPSAPDDEPASGQGGRSGSRWRRRSDGQQVPAGTPGTGRTSAGRTPSRSARQREGTRR